MSTIPITFNETYPSYTVIGGGERNGLSGLSVILLNRGGGFSRRKLFMDLEKTGFDTVVSVEPEPVRYDIEELSARFPFVRFVLLHGSVNLGGQINLAVSELDTPLFFVLWNDLRIITGGAARRMAERLTLDDTAAGDVSFKRLCTVPVLQNSRYDTLPTLIAPKLRRNNIETFSLYPLVEGLFSLYPFDGVGIYDRTRFMQLGGFDPMFKSNFWQLMDFGFRARLWGEEISATQSLRLSYDSSVPVEDTTVGSDYFRFYLKNLAPVFRHDNAILPLYRFPGYLLRSSGDIFSAWEDFSDSRRWVNKNRFRWRCDLRTVTNGWNLDAAGDPERL